MIRQIYIEEAVWDHPKTIEITKRYKSATCIPIGRYGEVFNVAGQNFRLQKQQPALILAQKHAGHVLETPPNYGIGGSHNYYFSHMLNCIYDCRYCFLQGMYRSAHYLVFVNFEDFFRQIETLAKQHLPDDSWFFSGYDCDSLALEPTTCFIDAALDTFSQLPHAHLEIRTKSTQIRNLLQRPPIENCVVAFSFTPHVISHALEHKVPAVEKRLAAMAKVRAHGWQVGLRLDPLIYSDDFEAQYQGLIESIAHTIELRDIHSVSLGAFRLPKTFYKKMVALYPSEALFAGRLDTSGATVSYEAGLEGQLRAYVLGQLQRHYSQIGDVLFECC